MRVPGNIWLEAAAELLLARVATLGPGRVYLRLLGRPGATPVRTTSVPEEARLIGDQIAHVAAAMPFRADCLQQVIATRRMLMRRGHRGTAVLGVDADNLRDAHAWFRVGDTVVSGERTGGDLSRFRIVAEFA